MHTPTWRVRIWLALLVLPSVCAMGVSTQEGREASERMRPPAALDCPRDAPASYSGRVVKFKRKASRIRVVIETDWGTREKVVFERPSGDVAARFLMEGEPFEEGDWSRIERSPGELMPQMRAIVWVCEVTETPPVIDWRPASG